MENKDWREQFDAKFPNLGATDPEEGWYDAKSEVKDFLTTKISQAQQEMMKKYTEDINFLKKIHSGELDALSLKSLEGFMKWAAYRRHAPVSPLTK